MQKIILCIFGLETSYMIQFYYIIKFAGNPTLILLIHPFSITFAYILINYMGICQIKNAQTPALNHKNPDVCKVL